MSHTAAEVLIAMFLLIAFLYGAILWQREGVIDGHDDELGDHDRQIASLNYRMEELLKELGLDIPDPIEDDSPEALQVYAGLAEVDKPDDDTEEFPALPATVPDGIAIQVQTALIEARDLSGEFPHPTDSDERKAKNAADIEEALKRFTFTGGRR